MAKPDLATKAAITQRRKDALTLRLAGLDLKTVGLKLAADPALNIDGIAYPQGYGCENYAKGLEPSEDNLRNAVSRDIRLELEERITASEEVVEETRKLEMERLDRLHLVVWQQALAGDLRGIDRAIRIQERRSRLLGLDAPKRLEHSGKGGAPIEVAGARETLIRLLGNESDGIETVG